MKKIIYLLVFVSHVIVAQERISLDTIFANDIHNVSMFFPSPVRQGIVGAENFTFSYNEETPQHFGLLKATAGKESSLLVLTVDGQIYSYFLKYREELPDLNHFITAAQSIGNEVPKMKDTVPAEGDRDKMEVARAPEDSLALRTFYKGISSLYLDHSGRNLKSKRKNKLKLSVKELAYHGKETFMVLELKNKSGIDFEVNYLNVYLTQGSRKKNASFQKNLVKPLYKFGLPEIVKDGQSRRIVYVLPKFTIGENERVEVEVREKRGNRYLNLSFKKY